MGIKLIYVFIRSGATALLKSNTAFKGEAHCAVFVSKKVGFLCMVAAVRVDF